MFGLVDGNNFYASCERVFDPSLIGKPVVVLSNNDGCAIARSNEAKVLGVKMGQPIHEVPDSIRKQLVVRSANFALYGDLSARIAGILNDLFPQVEVYSIDESFVLTDGIPDPVEAAIEARRRILKWTGIPCCVGLGPTKTLAKMGNKVAKKSGGVCDLTHVWEREKHLKRFPIEDLWGVGRRFQARLNQEGIRTAWDLTQADADTLRSRYGVVLSRTQRELQGHSCIELVEQEPDRKQIVVSRSFGKEATELDDVLEAVSTFAVRASEKMRERGLECGGVWVWMNTNPFKPNAPQYHPSKTFPLVKASSDTREILMVARGLSKAMYRKNYRFKKAGVGLVDLTRSTLEQGDLFSERDPKAQALMSVMDQANKRFGRGTVGLAATGFKQKPVWAMNQKARSPSYTSSWSELLRVR